MKNIGNVFIDSGTYEPMNVSLIQTIGKKVIMLYFWLRITFVGNFSYIG